jgi:hypothetical protein
VRLHYQALNQPAEYPLFLIGIAICTQDALNHLSVIGNLDVRRSAVVHHQEFL